MKLSPVGSRVNLTFLPVAANAVIVVIIIVVLLVVVVVKQSFHLFYAPRITIKEAEPSGK